MKTIKKASPILAILFLITMSLLFAVRITPQMDNLGMNTRCLVGVPLLVLVIFGSFLIVGAALGGSSK